MRPDRKFPRLLGREIPLRERESRGSERDRVALDPVAAGPAGRHRLGGKTVCGLEALLQIVDVFLVFHDSKVHGAQLPACRTNLACL